MGGTRSSPGTAIVRCGAWIVAALVLGLAAPGHADAAGSFSCSATIITTNGGPNGTTANPSLDPCASSDKGTPAQTFYLDPGPLLWFEDFRGASAWTRPHGSTPFYSPGASSGVDVGSASWVGLAGVSTAIEGVSSRASVTCSSGVPVLNGYAGITYLGVGYRKPATLPVNGVGTLHLNQVIREASEIVVRALWLELPGQGLNNDVVIGESRAGFSGDPC